MKNEMMSSGKGKRKITLDPRTKLALLLMVRLNLILARRKCKS